MNAATKIDLTEWYQIKEKLINQLIVSADLLDNRHVYVCCSRILGNTVSSAGSGMLIAGLALAPVTAGASLPLLAVVGGIVGCVGNVTSISSVIYEKVAERKDLEYTKILIDQFNANTEVLLSREASLYWNFLSVIQPGLSAYNAVNTCIKFFQFFDSVADTTETAGAMFTHALCTAGKIFFVFIIN